jgi:DNA-binding NtrC family response regulator
MADAKVLIVDDEVEFGRVLSERMEARGLSADTAESGMEAIEMIGKRSYDAVILDLMMPEMDGIETLKRLLEINPDLQIILLTGRATMDKGIEAVKLGAVEFLEKPAELNTLMEKIRVAQDKKMVLDEGRIDTMISDLMKKKGW